MTRNRHSAYLTITLCCVFAGIYTCLLTNREERYIMQYSKLSLSDQLIIKNRNGSFGVRFGFARLCIVHEFVNLSSLLFRRDTFLLSIPSLQAPHLNIISTVEMKVKVKER